MQASVALADLPRRRCGRSANCAGAPRQLAAELARVAEERGRRDLRALARARARRRAAPRVDGRAPRTGASTPRSAVLATNVFPSLLKRNRLMTVPVYDYVLMTEPLSDEQLASIGWQRPAGHRRPGEPVPLLPADAATTASCSAATTRSTTTAGECAPEYENRPQTFEKLASHFFTTFPQLEGLRFTHRWAGAIDTSTQFCAFFGTARDGPRRLRGRVHRARRRRRRASPARSCSTCSTGVSTERTELEMVRKRPLPVPARARRGDRHQRDALVARPRRPQRGPPQPPAEDARRARAGVRLVSRQTPAHPMCSLQHEPAAIRTRVTSESPSAGRRPDHRE